MLPVDVREAEAKPACEDGSAPARFTLSGCRERLVGCVADGVAGGGDRFGAADVAKGVAELRRIDLLLDLRPPFGWSSLIGNSGGGFDLDFTSLPRKVGGAAVGIRN